MSNINYFHNLNTILKHEAFPYQKEAFNEIKDLPYSAIFHEQGLGKTKIAIDLMLYWLKEKNIDCVFVVTKKQLVNNWYNEFKEHTHIIPKVLSSDKKDNFYVLNSTIRIIITNFETISSEKERIKLFLKTRNVAIVIDESTKIKNPDSKLSKDFFDISPLFKIKTIMTGTPVANRPYDIWSQIYFLDQGKSLGDDFNVFKNRTNLTNDLNIKESKREEFEYSVASIFDKIKNFTVRETKNSGIISLPRKKYYYIYANFEKCQKDMYMKIKDDLSILIQKNNEAILDENEETLKRLLRLVQVASNPRLVDDFYGYNSGKEICLDHLINEIISRNEKVIIWSSFIENIDYFYEKYKKYNPVKIHGKMTLDLRNKSVSSFKNDHTCKILFATPQSAKEGLTLTVANNVIFYDRGFNLDDYLQAQDRIHRISQKKECNIYNILMKDSVDIWIDKLLIAKQNAAFLAQGDYKLSQYEKKADYSFGDMIKQILNINKEDY